MPRQFDRDKRSDQPLGRSAASRGGNRGFVVREAMALYASLEDRLPRIEAEPDFRQMMRETSSDIESERVLTNAEVKKLARGKS